MNTEHTDIDDRFRQLVTELADTAPDPLDWSSISGREGVPEPDRRRPVALVAAGALVVAGAGAAALVFFDDDYGSYTHSTIDEPGTTVAGGPSVALGGGMARCAVQYDPADLDTLTAREAVFDGTVTAIGEPDEPRFQHEVGVTFEVHEWFVPDGPATVDVVMLAPGVISSNGTVDYGVGSRLLIVAGTRSESEPLDDLGASYCGFSRTYDEPTAAAWREAFASG